MAKGAVAVKEEHNVAIPEFMREQAGLGTENLNANDVEVPRIKLMQALSPELQEYNELKQGNFFHTLAEENLGTSVRVSPIFIDQRYILWRPQDTGGGILAKADDGVHWSPPNGIFNIKLKSGVEVTWKTTKLVSQSGLTEWGSSNPNDTNSPPAATRMYNVVVTFPDLPDLPPAVVTLQRSAIKVARRFIGKLKISRAPSFGLIFVMASSKDRNSAGQEFYNYTFKSDGLITDKKIYDANHEFYKHFKTQGVQIKDIEGAQQDDIPADTTDRPAF